jgi:signal transduction histidine kinase
VALELSVAAVPPAEGNARDALEVVIELLGWAARASGARGRVGVSTGFDGRAAWVRIEDDGPTLSEEIRRGFEQENGAGQGHGPLGRAAAAARRMRGALEVRAREPRGNAVTLRLPARPLA